MPRSPRYLPVLAVALAAAWATACSPERVLYRKLAPENDFSPASAPAAPDYTQHASWAAHPATVDKADLVPSGEVDAQASAPADVFFVHPTTFYSGSNWNAGIDTVRAREILDEAVIPELTSLFNACCRVFAPRYRQVTLATFFADAETAEGPMQVAYGDVKAAFRHFLDVESQGRPFFIASHSQGSLHTQRLLEELAMDPARERLVAAYVVGYRMPAEGLTPTPSAFGPCDTPTETGCVASWDTYQEGAEVRKVEGALFWQGGHIVESAERATQCVNPVSWRSDGAKADASAHRGAVKANLAVRAPKGMDLFTSDEATGLKLDHLDDAQPGLVSTQCVDGILRISAIPDEALARKKFFGSEGNYHLLDLNLFYLDIRANSVARVEAWLAAHPPAAPTPSPQPPAAP